LFFALELLPSDMRRRIEILEVGIRISGELLPEFLTFLPKKIEAEISCETLVTGAGIA
jgi:hypothetical protein